MRERSVDGEHDAFHVFDRWQHVGSAHSEEEAWELLATPACGEFDFDVYRILVKFLSLRRKGIEVRPLP